MDQDAVWQQRLRNHYHHLFSRVILPMILLAAAFLLLSHWQFGSECPLSVALVLGSLLALNAGLMWFSYHSRPIAVQPFRQMPGCIREHLHVFKWCVNFLLVAYLVWCLRVHTALTAVWVLLTFGALVEIRQRQAQYVVGLVAMVSFCVLLRMFYPVSVWMWLYLLVCYNGLVFIFLRLERYLQDEMIELFNTCQVPIDHILSF